MDYIREELLRQKRLLAALMTGGHEKEPEVEEGESGKEETIPAMAAADERVKRMRGEGETAVRLRERGERDGVSAAKTRISGIYSAGDESWRRWDAVPAQDSTLSAHVAPYGWTAPGPSADARDLSRSIQRDARRYDGGFSIY